MQFAADLAAFLLLRRENLAGQLAQLLLHAVRLFQQLAVMALTFPERILDRLALGDLHAQIQIRRGKFDGALAQHLDDLIQVGCGFPHIGMNFLNRDDRLGEESPRQSDERDAFTRGMTGQHLAHQNLFMELCQIQRLKADSQRLPAHAVRRLQAPSPTLFQVGEQRRLVVHRKFAFHDLSSSRATRRTDRTELTTNRCVLAILFLSPLWLTRASCLSERSRRLIPSNVWAISL